VTGPGTSSSTAAAGLEHLYRDLHAHPELSRQENRTAALTARVQSFPAVVNDERAAPRISAAFARTAALARQPDD
jgi:metal-dependent amidase/aminoacylase/carboxypeptidase family protein